MFTFDSELELKTIVEGVLYAILWEGEMGNSLDQMAVSYTDVEFLNQYFHENAEKLTYYRNPSYTPQDAVIRTQREVVALIQELKDLASDSLEDSNSLDALFKQLHTVEGYSHPRYYTDVKAKGHPDEAPWLRVYAVKCDDNLYVITGFGLKLVQDMRDDPELINQLRKLETATQYLRSEGMI